MFLEIKKQNNIKNYIKEMIEQFGFKDAELTAKKVNKKSEIRIANAL